MTDDSTPTAEAAVATIRAIVPPPAGDATGLRAYVTGEAGFEADRSAAVKGIDETLLLVTVRRAAPAAAGDLPLAARRARPDLVVVGVAYLVAGGLTYGLVAAGADRRERPDDGDPDRADVRRGHRLLPADRRPLPRRAAPDRGRGRGDGARHRAHRARRSCRPARSSIVAMLVLALADFNATREMGPILALGVAVMVVAGLTLLPAILATLGRRAFWPAVPRVAGRRAAGRRRLAPRSARLVGARPAATAAVVTAILLVGRARQPRRPRAARLLRGVPRAARVGARRAGDRATASSPAAPRR